MFSVSGSVILALVGSVLAASPPADAPLVQKLRLAPTAVDRLALLSDSDFTFDFFHSTSGLSTGAAGKTVAATPDNFPAIIGNGVAMTIGLLGPCGLNTPHTHPRATEFNFAVNGTFQVGTLAENGARFVMNELKPGQASVFPQGAIHFEQNLGCDTALFVAAFNGEDPGVIAMAQRYFGLPPDIIGATMGGLSEEQVASLAMLIPDNIALGVQECRQRCGLTSDPAPLTAQQQPRVSGNALPSSTAAVFVAAASPAVSSGASSGTSSTTGAADDLADPKNLDALSDDATTSSSGSSSSSNDNTPILIALVVVNGVLALAVIGAVILYFTRNRRSQGTSYSHKYETASKGLPRGDDFDEPMSSKKYYDPYAAAAQEGRPSTSA